MRNVCLHAAILANTLMSFPAVMTAPPTPTPSAHLPSQRRIRKHARMMESVCRSFTFSPPSASTAPCRSSSDPRKEAQASKQATCPNRSEREPHLTGRAGGCRVFRSLSNERMEGRRRRSPVPRLPYVRYRTQPTANQRNNRASNLPTCHAGRSERFSAFR
ncbi:hypothetical protein IWZ03DRAFT_213012 [Phyllosticta citriasiana]|uniref:Secreted protein n=1 Tax=Phyllosticta citriasiana TaxID=595635 RepID=A0ABR1KL49_9PEZI